MPVHGDAGWSFSFENNPLWKMKLKLQHSGWLQYMLPFVGGIVAGNLALLEFGIVGRSKPNVFLPLSGFFGALGIFDILTAKFDLRPSESIPPRKDHLTNLEIIKERHSCRSFQTRYLTDAHRNELLQVAQASIKDKLFDLPIRLEYIGRPVKVWPAVNCHEFFVAIAPKEYSQHAIWDLGRCLEKVVLHGIKMGLGTLIVGPGADHESIVGALGTDLFDPNKDHIICVASFGYPSRFAPLMLRCMGVWGATSRLPLDQLVFKDRMCSMPLSATDGEKLYKMLKPAFEAVRWAPSSYNAQSTRCSAVIENGNLVQLDFYRAINSKYYATVALGIWMAHWESACEELGLKGKFMVDKRRSEPGNQELPIYDISWVFDEPLTVE